MCCKLKLQPPDLALCDSSPAIRVKNKDSLPQFAQVPCALCFITSWMNITKGGSNLSGQQSQHQTVPSVQKETNSCLGAGKHGTGAERRYGLLTVSTRVKTGVSSAAVSARIYWSRFYQSKLFYLSYSFCIHKACRYRMRVGICMLGNYFMCVHESPVPSGSFHIYSKAE